MQDSNPDILTDTFGSEIFCPQCAYSLVGAPSDKCPECGYSIANMRSNRSQIPWVHRKERGRFRSYWNTVFLVAFRNRMFCEEYAHTLTYSDARRFRLITILITYLPILLITANAYLTIPPEPPDVNPVQKVINFGTGVPGPSLYDRTVAAKWPIVVFHMCIIPLLFLVTKSPGYLFLSRSLPPLRQSNAVVMSQYACGALALAPLLALAVVVLFWCAAAVVTIPFGFDPISMEGPFQYPWLFYLIGIVLAVGIWWLSLFRIARRTMPQLKLKAATIGLGVPVLWSATTIAMLVVIPLTISLVALVFVSLRD